MSKIKILSVGKTKEVWLQDALIEYEKRLPYTVDWILCKNDNQLEAQVPASFIALDPTGQAFTSPEFATWFEKTAPRAFVIGSAEGLTPTLRTRASQLISLSPLTFTHQMTRLVLLEQLYRATQILKNTGYHK